MVGAGIVFCFGGVDAHTKRKKFFCVCSQRKPLSFFLPLLFDARGFEKERAGLLMTDKGKKEKSSTRLQLHAARGVGWVGGGTGGLVWGGLCLRKNKTKKKPDAPRAGGARCIARCPPLSPSISWVGPGGRQPLWPTCRPARRRPRRRRRGRPPLPPRGLPPQHQPGRGHGTAPRGRTAPHARSQAVSARRFPSGRASCHCGTRCRRSGRWCPVFFEAKLGGLRPAVDAAQLGVVVLAQALGDEEKEVSARLIDGTKKRHSPPPWSPSTPPPFRGVAVRHVIRTAGLPKSE